MNIKGRLVCYGALTVAIVATLGLALNVACNCANQTKDDVTCK